jgi:hypothetical protein
MNPTQKLLQNSLGTDATRTRKFCERPQVAALIDAIATPAEVSAMNQKASMRFAQAVSFALSGDVKDCDEVTSALVALIVLSQSDRVTFTDAQIVAGASKEGNPVAGVSRARLARFLPRTSNLGTITSKVSRTVGKGKKGAGMFQALVRSLEPRPPSDRRLCGRARKDDRWDLCASDRRRAVVATAPAHYGRAHHSRLTRGQS